MSQEHNRGEIGETQRRMAERSMLADDDPERAAFENQLAETERQSLALWREQTAERVALRDALADVAPPPGLQQRLLDAKHQRAARGKFRQALLAAAACAAAACIASIVAWRSIRPGDAVRHSAPVAPFIAETRAAPTAPAARDSVRLLTQRDYQLEFARSPERLQQWISEPAPMSAGGDSEWLRAQPWRWADEQWLQ